ncbi:unnamed protein product, partial [Pylaiella littoralis]
QQRRQETRGLPHAEPTFINARRRGGVFDHIRGMGSKHKGTKWGTLNLVENPVEPATPNFTGPVSDKVPRTIHLCGKHTFVGRGKKLPAGGQHPQTTIELSYISSGHCCFSLRKSEGGPGATVPDGEIEAVVKDTSSNGTYVDAVRVPKGNTVVFTEKTMVALYLPQSNVALGRPILYQVQLHPEAFEKAILETLPASSTRSAGRMKRVKSAESNSNSNSISNGNGNSNSIPLPASAAASPKKMPQPLAANSAGAGAAAAVAPARPSLSSQDHTPGAATRSETMGKRRAVADANANATGKVPFSSPTRGRNEWLDDQVKMREEAVAKATKEWEEERERMAKDARDLRSRLESSVSQNKQLLTDKNVLQEKLASADSTRRREEEQAQQQRQQLHNLEAELIDSEAQKAKAEEGARRDRARAAASERSEACAKQDFERKETELREQISGLIAHQQQAQQKLADVAAESKSWNAKFEEGQLEFVETQAKLSTLVAQLKDAQESTESSRAKLAEEEAASAEAKRARALAEGELARSKNQQLEVTEAARQKLQGFADEAKRLAAELQDSKSSSSRTSKGLEQALSELEEERRARQGGLEELSKVEGEVAELRSEEKRLKKLLDEALVSGGTAKADASQAALELEESQKRNRGLEAELLQAKLDLDVSKNRRDGVKGEARFLGTNVQKAKQKAVILGQELRELMGYLEIPTGLMADSQGFSGGLADSVVDDVMSNGNGGSLDVHGSAVAGGHESPQARNSEQEEAASPTPSLGNDMDDGERWDATQMSPSAAAAAAAAAAGAAAAGCAGKSDAAQEAGGVGRGNGGEETDEEVYNEEIHEIGGDEDNGDDTPPKQEHKGKDNREGAEEDERMAEGEPGGEGREEEHGATNGEEEGGRLM